MARAIVLVDRLRGCCGAYVLPDTLPDGGKLSDWTRLLARRGRRRAGCWVPAGGWMDGSRRREEQEKVWLSVFVGGVGGGAG